MPPSVAQLSDAVLRWCMAHWSYTPPLSFDNALIAIASVAAVVWTGGLIIRQLYPQYITIEIQSGMEYCMFASLASIFGLMLTGWPLGLAAMLFLVLYGHQWIQSLRTLYALNCSPEKAFPEWVADQAKYEQDTFTSTRLTGWLLVPYPLVIAFPYQAVVALVSVIVLYFGYQLILAHMNTAWSSPVLKRRNETKLERLQVKGQRQMIETAWQLRMAQLLTEIRDRLPSRERGD